MKSEAFISQTKLPFLLLVLTKLCINEFNIDAGIEYQLQLILISVNIIIAENEIIFLNLKYYTI